MIDGEYFEMRLGLPGTGKTLNQTELVVLPALLDGIDVWVNYWVNWAEPNYHYFKEFEQVQNVRNGIVVFDEIGKILDPRNWEAEGSGVRDFFQQHRKRHIDISGNTQHISLIAKSALIEVSNFLMCYKSFDGDLLKALWPSFPWVVAHEQEMTLKEIKIEDSDFVAREPYDDEFEKGKIHSHWFNKKKLLHRELDEFKTELLHHYCSRCMQRQEPTISLTDSCLFAEFDQKKQRWFPLENRKQFYCPKHKEQLLEVRESGMYDSDYEILSVEKPIVFRPFYKTLKEAPYRGSLSPAQAEIKNKLESLHE